MNTLKLLVAFILIGLFTMPFKSFIVAAVILIVVLWLLGDVEFDFGVFKKFKEAEKTVTEQTYGVRYPVAFHTVDIAITKTIAAEPADKNDVAVLLIQKPGETSWRFPGGFVDPTDDSAELAATREAHEEAGKMELDKPRYICSKRIDDPRYRTSPHKIITSFYEAQYMWGKEQAGDDAARAEWFKLGELFNGTAKDSFGVAASTNPIHADLFTALYEKKGLIKNA